MSVTNQNNVVILCITFHSLFRDASSPTPCTRAFDKPMITNSPVYKNNLNYIRKRSKNTITMADLEQEKDLEEDEFKTNVKPSTSREVMTRICKKDVIYQFNESDLDEDTDESLEDEEDEYSSNGYSSPDIDYDAVANYEQNSPESTKIHAKYKDQGNESQQNVDSDNSEKSDDLYNYDPGCDYE